MINYIFWLCLIGVTGSSDYASSSVTSSTSKDILPKQSSMQLFLLAENVTRAEILWCLCTIANHLSLRSSAACTSLFPVLFSDSDIAKKIQLQRTKLAYAIVYGIVPIFHRKLSDLINRCDTVVLEFDESLNTVSQITQMDIHVRFWDQEKSLVTTRYFDSAFIQRTRAIDLLDALKKSFGVQNLRNILQLSMDGPNVNFKVLKELNKEIKESFDGTEILQMGNCSLHVVHGSFKTGISKTMWEIVPFLKASFFLFHDSPARRGQYTEYTKSSLFPQRFCGIRWIENATVAERVLELLPHLRTYVAKSIEEKTAPSTSASFKTVSNALEDKLLGPKLAFFSATARLLEPFLLDFQSDDPMAPFLYNDLFNLTSTLMQRVVKSHILTSGNSLMKIDIQEKKNLITAKEFELDFSTRSELKKVKGASELDVLRLKEEMRCCIVGIIEKLRERSPLKYSLTRAISCLDPNVVLDQEKAVKRMTLCLEILVSSQRVSGAKADRIKQEFVSICSNVQIKERVKLFKRNECRLDTLWMDVIQLSSKYCTNFSDFVKLILILSHGNAVVERGFSINSECIVANQNEKSLVAQRQIYDEIQNAGGVENFPIDKSLIHSMRNAYSFYKEDKLNQRRTLEKKEEHALLLKRKQSEIKTLESKKANMLAEAAKISAEIESLNK